MDARLALRIAVAALAGPDAGRSACDHGLPARFRARVLDCLSALDEAVAGAVARQWRRLGEPLVAVNPVAADDLAAERRSAGRNAAGRAFQKDDEVAVAQDAAHRERSV